MGFKLLDVEKFIKEKHAKPVLSEKTFVFNKVGFEPDPNGLYSYQIFGRTIKEQRDRYGYINLKQAVMHPLIYKNLKKISSLFESVAKGKKFVKIVDGELIEVPQNEGKTGINFLIQNWKNIDFDKYKKESNSFFIEFLKHTQDKLIFPNKIPVIPVIYRPYTFEKGRVIEDEITDIYKKILFEINKNSGNQLQSQNATLDFNVEKIDLDNLFDNLNINTKNTTEKLQKYITQLFDYFISKLEKKEGFFRGAYVGKRLDNVARLVANARPDIPVDCVAIPWHVLLSLFDYYVIAILEKYPEYKKKLGLENINISDFGKHIYYIYKNCDIYCKNYPDRQDIWIEVLKKMFNEYPYLRVILKRDPGWSSFSFWSLKPIITRGCQYHIVVNSFYYKPLGGDSFRSNVIFIKTKENKIIKKFSKQYNKDIITITFKHSYSIKTIDTIWKSN